VHLKRVQERIAGLQGSQLTDVQVYAKRVKRMKKKTADWGEKKEENGKSAGKKGTQEGGA